MIGPSIIIKGEVSGEEDLLIQGKVEGTIHMANNEVSVGESGQVSADIKARVAGSTARSTGILLRTRKWSSPSRAMCAVISWRRA